jgi:tRNA-splicing ligase RtcB
VWARKNEVDSQVIAQLKNVAALPWVCAPRGGDARRARRKGATVGSVIAMRGAVAPAAVGVDIGCGMTAVETSLTARDLPDDLGRLRYAHRGRHPVGKNAHAAPPGREPPPSWRPRGRR